ncbi:MAG: arginase family protein [Actinomycetota bacterium]
MTERGSGDRGGGDGEGPLDMPFVGIPSFQRAPVVADLDALEADVSVVGVLTDEGSPFMPGSRFGPRAIREHSLRFTGGGPGYYDPQRGRRFLEPEMRAGLIADVGDADVLPRTSGARSPTSLRPFGRCSRGGTGVTSYLAAHTVIEFLGRICDQPRWVSRRDRRAAQRAAAAELGSTDA